MIHIENNSVRQGPYEVQIVDDAGQPLPIMDFNGQPCARSQCSMTYKIKVIVHRDLVGAFPASHLMICAKVDGRSVGYHNRFELDSTRYKGENQASTFFDGFQDSSGDVLAFKFASVQVARSNEKNSAAGQKEVGSIVVTINAAEPTTETSIRTPVKAQASLKVGVDEDKKFWQSPSAVTVVGEKVRTISHNTKPSFRWKMLHPSLAELTLYYHTPEMFNFIKDFRVRLPTNTDSSSEGSSNTVHSAAARRPLPPVQVLPGGRILVDLTAEEEADTVAGGLPAPAAITGRSSAATARSCISTMFAILATASATPTTAATLPTPDASTITVRPNSSTVAATIPAAITPTTTAATGRPRSPEWKVWMDQAVEGTATSHLPTTASILTTASMSGSNSGAPVRTSNCTMNPTTTAAMKTPDSKKRPYNNLFS